MLALCLAVVGHVPTYGRGVENCHTPPHHHDTSQVIYLKGSGGASRRQPHTGIHTLQISHAMSLVTGLEIHCSEDDCPFSWNETLDVDAVFRDEVDQSTYSLYIG